MRYSAPMQADLMRMIDRWCGIPACMVLTWWRRLLRPFRRAAPASRLAAPPRRILFIGLAEIGALIVNHAAIARARRLFPEAELYFLSFAQGEEALAMMGFDEAHRLILRANAPHLLALDTLRVLPRLRRLGIDATVNFEVFVRFSTLLAALSGAARRVGFHPFATSGQYIGDLLTHRVVYSPHHHASRMSLALVEALAEPASAEPKVKQPAAAMPFERLLLPPDPARLAAIRDKLAAEATAPLPQRPRFVLLNANASDLVAVRRWPAERYAELGRRLLADDPDIVVVLTGIASERAQATAIAGDIDRGIGGGRVVNLAGRTTLRELIDLFHAADLLVTNDSGPAHFASVTDVPTVVLFGPETPRIFGPLGPRQEAIWLGLACSPCVSVYNQKRSSCTDNRCMILIDVARVHDRARALMSREPAMAQ